MATSTIDELVVSLGLDPKKFNSGMNTVMDACKSLDNAIKALGASLAFVFVKNQITKISDMSQHLDLLSKKTGISTDEIQAWGNAVKIQGGSIEGFESTLQHFANEMQNITTTGNSAMVPMLTRLGITYRNVGGGLKTPIQLLRELSSRFQGMSSQQAFSLAKKFGIDDGTVLLLQKGEKGISQILDKTSHLAALNEKDIKRGIELRKSWQELSLVFQKFAIRIGAAFLPAVQQLAKWGDKIASWMSKNGENIQHIMEGLVLVIGTKLALQAIPALLKALSGLAHNPGFLAIASFIALWDDLRTFMKGGESVFNWKPIIDAFEKFVASPVWKKLKDLFGSIWELLKGVFGLFSDLFGLLSDIGVFNLFAKALEGIAWALEKIVDAAKYLIDKIGVSVSWIRKKLGATSSEEERLGATSSKEEKEIKAGSVFTLTPEIIAEAQKATAPVSPLVPANSNIANNNQTTTTTIENVNINTNSGVDANSIKRLANTTNTTASPTQLALQSNYGM